MSLNERAMKVTLKRTRPSLTKRDVEAEQFVQGELGDAALVVNKKLFRDPNNPVNKILRALDQVYTYHKQNTLPFVDAGPRLLPNHLYFEYTTNMRSLCNEVESLMTTHMPNYDQYVSADIAWRTKQATLSGKSVNASLDEYPTAAEFQSSVTVKLRFEQLPEAPHCVFDEDKAEIEKVHRQIEIDAGNAVLRKMLEPLQHLASKLDIPIGEKGFIFRDSALENIKEGIAAARRLTITPSEDVATIMQELETAVDAAGAKMDWLRESPINRKATADRMKEIAAKMGSLMQ